MLEDLSDIDHLVGHKIHTQDSPLSTMKPFERFYMSFVYSDDTFTCTPAMSSQGKMMNCSSMTVATFSMYVYPKGSLMNTHCCNHVYTLALMKRAMSRLK